MKAIADWWRAEDLRGLWMTTVLVAIFAVAAVMPLTPHDLWFHIRLGQQMLEQRALVTTDVFSFTRFGQPYFYNAWLGEIVLYALWMAGGAPLLVLVRALLVVFFYAVAFWLCYRTSHSERFSAAFVLLAAMASYPHWQLRPQSFGMPIFAVFVLILSQYHEQRRAPLFMLPLLMIAWVNLHGSFVFGLIIIGLAVVGEGMRCIVPMTGGSTMNRVEWVRLGKWGLLTFAAMFVNPLGIGMVGEVSDIGSDPSIQGWVLEWLPPNAREFPASIFFLLVLAFLFGLAFSRKRLSVTQGLWVAIFTWLGWIAYRNVLWAGVVLAPLLAVLWKDIGDQVKAISVSPAVRRWTHFLFRPRKLMLMRALIVVVLTLVAAGTLPPLRAVFIGNDLRAWVSADTPVDVVNYVRQNDLRGRTFHEIGAGSFMLWALWPQQQVFVDSRINLYPADLWREYFAVTNGLDGFEDILDKYQIDYLLADSFWQPQLLAAVQKRPARWSLLFHSGESFLFQRVGSVR